MSAPVTLTNLRPVTAADLAIPGVVLRCAVGDAVHAFEDYVVISVAHTGGSTEIALVRPRVRFQHGSFMPDWECMTVSPTTLLGNPDWFVVLHRDWRGEEKPETVRPR